MTSMFKRITNRADKKQHSAKECDIELANVPRREETTQRKSVTWSESEKSVTDRPLVKNNEEASSSSDGCLTSHEISEEETSNSLETVEQQVHIPRKLSTRYEDRLRQEADGAENAYSTYRKRSHGRKRRSPRNRECLYDFFVRTEWIKKNEVLEEQEYDNDTGESLSVDVDDRKHLLTTNDIIGDRYNWNEVSKFRSADTRNVREEEDKHNFFETCIIPSKKIVFDDFKGNKPLFKRCIKEEGLYVGQKFKNRNNYKMENRVVLNNKRLHNTWFESDGSLIAPVKPFLPRSVRPEIIDEFNAEMESVYCPASLPGADINFSSDITRSKTYPHSSRRFSHTRYLLEIDVCSVVFLHHHLFSLEHTLVQRVVEKFEIYQRCVTYQLETDLEGQLDVLYASADKVASELASATEDTLDEKRQFQKRRLNLYYDRIDQIWNENNEECKRKKEITNQILNEWKELLKIRKQQNYASTSFRLIIKKEKIKMSLDKKNWNKKLDREVEQARQEYEMQREASEAAFKENLEIWHKQHIERKKAARRLKLWKKNSENGVGCADVDAMAEDEELLAKSESPMPEQPTEFNATEYRAQLEKLALECHRAPGEPKITLEISQEKEAPLDQNDVSDNREKSRRNAVLKTKIFFKIFFNDKEVCVSSACNLTDEFVANFGQIIPIQIYQWPESLILQVVLNV